MFGVSFTEGLLLLIVGLLVLGPEKLPEAAKAAARWYARIKQMINQVQGDFSREFDLQQTQESIRAQLSELKKLSKDVDAVVQTNQILPDPHQELPNLPMQGYYFLLGAHARARRLPKPPRLPDMSKDRLISELTLVGTPTPTPLTTTEPSNLTDTPSDPAQQHDTTELP